MNSRTQPVAMIAAMLVWAAACCCAVSAAERYVEPPSLRAKVRAGELPPVEQRVPDEPLVVGPGDVYGVEQIGRYGGVLRFDAADPMNVQGMTDITTPFFFDSREENFHPLVFKAYEASDDFRTWTIQMRKGMRWSDGHPFTSEDVKFWFEASATNRDLSPVPPTWLTEEDGTPATLEILDAHTFRFRFGKPRLRLLASLASCERQITACPKHYLSQFHAAYADRDDLERRVAQAGMVTWTQLWQARADGPVNSNPDLPTLCPWRVRAGIPNNPARYERNPYYWVVDRAGNQLPYADEVWHTVVGNPERMKLRAVLGNVSFAPLPLDSVELARLEADKGHVRIFLRPPAGDINAYTLGFNFATPDPLKRRLLNDRRFRVAMSLQMPREMINQVIDNGLTHPKQIGVSGPSHRWYNRGLATAHLEHDVGRANRLLDEIGLARRDSAGMRIDPGDNDVGEGQPIVFSLMTVQHDAWTQACEIIAEHLPKVGLQANLRTVGWDGFGDALRAGQWELWLFQDLMGYPHQWPDRMDAVRPSVNNAYPWMRWMETNGQVGQQPPDLMRQCWRRWKVAQSASTDAELAEHINWLQSTAAEQLWAVGINGFPPSLWVVAPHVRNVAERQAHFLKSAVFVLEK